MKLNAAVMKSLLMAASIGTVVPLVAQTPSKSPPAAKTKPAPATPAAPAKEEEPVIDGIEVVRKNGGYLGVTVDGVRLVVKFYDAKKKPVAVDVARAAARWNPLSKTGDERSVLNPSGDGRSLVSTPVLRPPHVYKVFLTLLDAEGNVVESPVVDLRQLNEPKTKTE